METKSENIILHTIKINGDSMQIANLTVSLRSETSPKIKKAFDGTWVLQNTDTEESGYFQPKYGIFEDTFGKTKYNIIPDNYEPVILPGASNPLDIEKVNKILNKDIADAYGIKAIQSVRSTSVLNDIYYDFTTGSGNFIPVLLKLSTIYDKLKFTYSFRKSYHSKYEAVIIQNGEIIRWDYDVYL